MDFFFEGKPAGTPRGPLKNNPYLFDSGGCLHKIAQMVISSAEHCYSLQGVFRRGTSGGIEGMSSTVLTMVSPAIMVQTLLQVSLARMEWNLIRRFRELSSMQAGRGLSAVAGVWGL